jgi:RHS repeat-associated protein
LSETYACDRLGNLRVKAGVGYEYPAARQPRPHAPIRVGGQPYAYDANGNLTSGGGRTFVWNGWNQLASVSQAGVTETYAYDAAGARVTRTSNGATIVTVADLWERTVGGATTHFYRFGADIIGVRRSDQGTQYLFSDHLGSVSAATTASGTLVGMQHYDPWGRVRTGGIGLTARTFTGQRLDATGLLYYHARYYDPTLGRFISPDSIVPGAGALTAAPHDAVAQLAWAQGGSAPTTPQELNRYAYAQNAPLRFTDPTGHCVGLLAGVDTLTCIALIGGGMLLAGALVAVAASPSTGMRWSDYDWTDWSLPGFAVEDSEAGDDPVYLAPSQRPQTDDPQAATSDKKPTTLAPGPYAGESIPARGPGRDFTPEERDRIDEIGRTTGCHTCGATDPGTRSGRFIPDHQPPNQLNPDNRPQRLYPHCRQCSQRQDGEVNAARQLQQRTQPYRKE